MKLYVFALILFFGRPSQANTVDDIVKFLDGAYKVLDGITKLLPLPEGAGKSINELAALYKYPLDLHSVVTEDGYKLSVFRIPHGRNENARENVKKPVVLLVPGIGSSAGDFINMGPNRSLGCILADEGYDVWLGNPRGNKYSRAHTSLDPDKNASFWDFSWHEHGIYDLPSMIDYILTTTEAKKISYIGHSEGNTDFFVMGAEKPKYNDKISLAVALGPVAYMTNMSSPLIVLFDKYMSILQLAASTLGIHEIPATDWIRIIGEIVCNDDSGLQFVCVDVLGFLLGFDNSQVNATILSVILTNYPSGLSTKQLFHYGQEISSGHFRQYDYGVANLVKYGSLGPPNYNLSAITAPVALYYASNDLLVATANVDQLAQELPNVVKKTLLEYKFFNHYDYLWAIDVKTLLYDDLLDLLKQHKIY